MTGAGGGAGAVAVPPVGAPEIAFAGRSNVGKSSLINALTGRSGLARTSRTPGRTQELIFFDLDGKARLVDMPGYGYAAVAKSKSVAWGALARDYLRGRVTLKRVYLLIDARHGLKSVDTEALDALDLAAVSYQIVLTKADKIKATDLAVVTQATADEARKRPAAHPDIIATSSEGGLGIPELRAAVLEAIG